MDIETFGTKEEMGAAAAAFGVSKLKEVLDEKGSASFIVATGASQFEMLASLAGTDLPWNKLTGFHLDEYVGLSINHEASFRKYLWERFVSTLPLPLAAFHFLDGEGDAEAAGIYSDAYEGDTEFYRFWRSLNAYRDSFGAGEGNMMVLDPSSDFFRYLKSADPQGAGSQPQG